MLIAHTRILAFILAEIVLTAFITNAWMRGILTTLLVICASYVARQITQQTKEAALNEITATIAPPTHQDTPRS